MLISESKGFIFYHLYKVAGTSIRSELIPYCSKVQVAAQAITHGLGVLNIKTSLPPIYYYHPKLIDVKKYLGDDFYRFYRFCFVRNPLDWQKSLYFFAKINKRHHQHDLISSMSFDDYIEWRVFNDLKLQSEFLYDGDECLVDFIGRFEAIDRDFSVVCRHLKIPYGLKHLNVAGKGKEVMMSARSLDLFRDAFRSDYSRLGYDIDDILSK